jgi:hypothetical protein
LHNGKRAKSIFETDTIANISMMSIEVLGVASKLGIPTYTFFPSNASALAAFVQVPLVRAGGQPSLNEMGDTPLNFHGVPPVSASHLVTKIDGMSPL